MIQDIVDKEQGVSVRGKMNQVIAKANKVDDKAEKGGNNGQDFEVKTLKTHSSTTESNDFTYDNEFNFIGNNYNENNSKNGNLYINYRGANIINPIMNYIFTNGTNDYRNLANVKAASFNPFTGCHIIPKENINFKIGELICIEAIPNKDKKQPDWRGRYPKRGENGIFGIIYNEMEEEIKGDNDITIAKKKQYLTACLGDMKVFCNGENGDIIYGDELCASSTHGVAMKYTGEYKDRNQVCGKAGRSYNFKGAEKILIDTTKE